MGYFRTGYEMLKDADGQGRVNYGEACRFAKDTMHGLGMAAFGGAGVALALGRPVAAAGLGAFGKLSEVGAWVNRDNVERFEERQQIDAELTSQIGTE